MTKEISYFSKLNAVPSMPFYATEQIMRRSFEIPLSISHTAILLHLILLIELFENEYILRL